MMWSQQFIKVGRKKKVYVNQYFPILNICSQMSKTDSNATPTNIELQFDLYKTILSNYK